MIVFELFKGLINSLNKVIFVYERTSTNRNFKDF